MLENQRRMQALIEKNEKTKALIKKRDESRARKLQQQLETAAKEAIEYNLKKKHDFSYCSAETGFGNRVKTGRVNHFRPAKKNRQLQSDCSLPDIQTAKLGINASINNDLITQDVKQNVQKPPLPRHQQAEMEPMVENSDFCSEESQSP